MRGSVIVFLICLFSFRPHCLQLASFACDASRTDSIAELSHSLTFYKQTTFELTFALTEAVISSRANSLLPPPLLQLQMSSSRGLIVVVEHIEHQVMR